MESIRQAQIIAERLRYIDIVVRRLEAMLAKIRSGGQIILSDIRCRKRLSSDEDYSIQMKSIDIRFAHDYNVEQDDDTDLIDMTEIQQVNAHGIEIPEGVAEFVVEEALKNYMKLRKSLSTTLFRLSAEIEAQENPENSD